MTANTLDLDVVTTGFVVAPVKADGSAFTTNEEVNTFLAAYHIIDLRSSGDFNAGHINGAKNVAFANILAEITAAGAKKMLVVCYTGQTACYATGLLRLYGKADAVALKWGMSGWNASYDRWTANTTANPASTSGANWTTAAAPTEATYELPTITSALTEGSAILKERVETIVSQGFTENSQYITATTLLANPSNYFINNYFSAANYTEFGHVVGAHRINPMTLASTVAGTMMKNLDPSKTIVTYCYTGQTSAIITAYLRVLGYNAYSLSFGMNGLYNSNTAWGTSTADTDYPNKWKAGNIKNYATVTK
jgi:rhodanese-related sulfurtransferase